LIKNELIDRMHLKLNDKNPQMHLGYEKYGEFCPYVYLDSSLAHILAGWMLVKNDLEFSKTSFEALLSLIDNKEQEIIQQSLFFSGVIKYAKCFVSAEGRRVKLMIRNILKNNNDEKIKIHNELIDLRHNFVAHAGESDKERMKTVLILNPDKSNQNIENLRTVCMFLGMPSENMLKRYINLINIVLKEIDPSINEKEKALNKEINSKPIAYWYEQAIYPEKVQNFFSDNKV